MPIELGVSGLASGFDWRSLVDQLVDVERAPERRLRIEQGLLGQRNNAYTSIATALNALKGRVDALKSSSLFESRTAKVADSGIASAGVSGSAAPGSYTFNFLQLATSSAWEGTANAGNTLAPSSNVSAVVLQNAALATPVTAGKFTVNGAQVTIALTDTLQQAFDKISTATGGAVTGSYSSATDKITLNSATPIILGSATDSSNFLTAARLNNTGTNSVTSTAALGVVKTTVPLANANFATPVSDGGSHAGQFTINGTSISFDAAVDSMADVMARINSSAAGVTASYDTLNDRFTLTSRTTGDLGIAMQDVTGNFLAASRLSTGVLTRGKDLVYNVNGGSQLTSHSNVISDTDHGIQGLTVTALRGAETISGTPNTLSSPMLIGQFGGSGIQTRVRSTPPHNLQHGHAIRFQTTGTLPSQIDLNTTYWVRRVDANNVTIHRTAADASANANAINFGNSPASTGDAYMMQVDPLTGGSTTGPASTTTITVASDTAKVKTAITDFLADYNKVQSLIGAQTASTTDSSGKVTAAVLASEGEANDLASRMRAFVNGATAGLTGAVRQLDHLGITSNGNDDNLALTDTARLDAALASNLGDIKTLFSDATEGLGTKLSAFLENTVGDAGSVSTRQTTLAKQIADIDKQVIDMERIIQANRQRLIDSFVAMETAQSNINQQLQYLTKRFG